MARIDPCTSNYKIYSSLYNLYKQLYCLYMDEYHSVHCWNGRDHVVLLSVDQASAVAVYARRSTGSIKHDVGDCPAV